MRKLFPSAILPAHKAFLGKTGSGKTSTAKLLIEQVVTEDDARVCVLDTTKSDWWGLISSADGKKPGLPFVVLGGPHGHVPLHSSAGKAIAELVASGRLRHSIIDMADFEAGGAQRFFVDFAPALLRNMKGVLYLVIEEAHELAPKERSGFDKENMAVHYAKKLATAGRSKGIRLLVLTQRTQALHNAVLGSCEVLVAHRLTAPADQEPVLKWLKANTPKQVAESIGSHLAGLKTGTGWLVSGEAGLSEIYTFPRITTYDNTATPDSDDDAHQVASAHVDQAELRALIGDAVEEAESKDPKRLQAEVTRLRTELAKRGTGGGDAAAEYTRGRAEGFDAGRLKGRSEVMNHVNALESRLSAARGALNEAMELAKIQLPPIDAMREFGQSAVSRPEVRAAQRAATEHARHAMDAVASGLPTGELAILKALGMYRDGMDRDELSVLTGYKKSSRDTYIARLIGRGLASSMANGKIAITAPGIEALGSNYQPLPTGLALQDFWIGRLPEGERNIFRIVVESYPKEIDRGEISARSGYKKSSRDTYLSRLSRRRLVEFPADGQVVASASLF